jgi:hypothetical protein
MRRFRALPITGAVLALSLLFPAGVSAHERRDVGNYQLVVGWLTEPAIGNQLNGIDLAVTSKSDNKPVEGVERTLKAEVIVGGNARSMPISLQARFNMPGRYAGYFEPTAPGAYIFHFSGTINGEAVDQRFESGPGRFDDVQPLTPLQFPNKTPDPAELRAEADQARQLAIVGIALGAAGLALGLWRRRPAA